MLLALSTGAAHADDSSDPSLTQVVKENETVAPRGTTVEITSGHVDMGPRLIDGKWEFMIRDDSGSTPTWRYLEDVVFRVSDKAKITMPESKDYSFIDAKGQVYVLPQQEIRGVVWLGWNTQDPGVVKSVNGGVQMIYSGHQGDGQLVTFLQSGNFGAPEVLWNSEKKQSQPVFVDLNTHTHANWVFTKPGIQLVKMTVEAQLNDGSTVSKSEILRFAVGDKVDAAKTLATKWTQTNDITPAKAETNAEPSALDKSTSLPLIIAVVCGVVAVVVILFAVMTTKKRNALKKAAAAKAAGTADAPQTPNAPEGQA